MSLLTAVIVAMSVIKRNNGKGRAFLNDRMSKLDGEMEGIAQTAAVSHGQKFFAISESFRHVAAQSFDVVGIFLEELLLHFHALAALAQNLVAETFVLLVDRVIVTAVVMTLPPLRSRFFQMSSVRVICGAGAFSGNHGCAERMFGSALLAERRTIVRFLHAFEHQAADANLRLLRVDFLRVENSVGIVIAKFIAQFVAAFRNRTDSAPFAVAHFEDFIHQILRDAIAVALNDSRILIFHLVRARLRAGAQSSERLREYPAARIQ